MEPDIQSQRFFKKESDYANKDQSKQAYYFEKTESKVQRILCLKWKQMSWQVGSKIFSFISNTGCKMLMAKVLDVSMHTTRWHLVSGSTFRGCVRVNNCVSKMESNSCLPNRFSILKCLTLIIKSKESKVEFKLSWIF